jgi:carboxymethylenebutenolidase
MYAIFLLHTKPMLPFSCCYKNASIMKKLPLLLSLIGFSVALFAQKKNKKTNTVATEKVCLTMSCCDEGDAPKASATDEAFMATATTASFGSMHQEPLPFVLEDQKGSMLMFNCADGIPGNAYGIMASTKTNKYLIVIQEWWGLNDHIKKEAEKYYSALDGKVNVLAVDLYDGKVATTVDSAQKFIRAALSSTRKETILQGALDYAGKDAHVYTVGWCFGGMMSLQTAILGGNKIKGAVMFYGSPEKDKTKIAKIQSDVLGIFGTQDRSIPNETVDAFANEMKAAGKNFTLLRYDAVHAFANPSNPAYNKEFGDDAFLKSIAFLKSKM